MYGYAALQEELRPFSERENGSADPKEGDVSEDVTFCDIHIAQDKAFSQQASLRKGKKLLAWSQSVDGEQYKRVVRGDFRVPRHPPFGKVWAKQISSRHNSGRGTCTADPLGRAWRST